MSAQSFCISCGISLLSCIMPVRTSWASVVASFSSVFCNESALAFTLRGLLMRTSMPQSRRSGTTHIQPGWLDRCDDFFSALLREFDSRFDSARGYRKLSRK